MMVTDYFLRDFPSPDKLGKVSGEFFFEANAHIHTPYSFSAFRDLDEIFMMAVSEKVRVLGINDFYVTDGYPAFHDGCLKNGIFPLFNVEFIGLMKDEQNKGIRINDPNNPGRIYFCGKGMDYPFHPGEENSKTLKRVKEETQNQLRAMVSKLNRLIAQNDPSFVLGFDEIRQRFARDLVRERHLAKALRVIVSESSLPPEQKLAFIESLYGGRKSKYGFENPAALENEIRSNLLKAGGAAFVEENESSFMEIERIIGIISDAGGIPCYPVLLDDASGSYTEFESDPEKLYASLKALGIGCIELIPGRNDHDNLERFVEYFDSRNFIITFGTEHNTPEMIPLTVAARGNKPLSVRLKRIGMKGAQAIAAHQYLRAQKREGYTCKKGLPGTDKKEMFESLGRQVLEFYFNRG